MINLFKAIAILLLLPFVALAQADKPENISGSMIFGEKPLEFNYLSMPDGSTTLAFFKQLPGRSEYIAGTGKEFISLEKISALRIIPFSDDENEMLRENCNDCQLYKARITFFGNKGYREEFVFLAFDHLIWKNTHTADYKEPRKAELRFLEEIEINNPER
jgi:hypothetical protein